MPTDLEPLYALLGARPTRRVSLPVRPSRTSTDRYSEAAAADPERAMAWRDETQIFVNALRVGDVLSPEDVRRGTEPRSLLPRLPASLTGVWLDDGGDAWEDHLLLVSISACSAAFSRSRPDAPDANGDA